MKRLVFATTIRKEKDAMNIANLLQNYFNLKSANFDLDQKEALLKVEGPNIIATKIERTLTFLGFQCRLLVG